MSTIDGFSAGLQLTTGESLGADADTIVLTKLEGWDGGGTMRRSSTPRLNAAGDFAERGHRGAKLVSIYGDAEFTTRQAAAQFVLQLEACLADGTGGTLTVTEDDLELIRSLDIYLTDGATIDRIETSVTFAFDTIAPDPYKYGAEETVIGDTAAWTNIGTAPARLAFEIFGDHPDGITITETTTGRQIIYTPALVAGDPLRIDCVTGTAFIGTTDVSTGLTLREWPTTAAAATTEFILTGTANTDPSLHLKGTPLWH
jgi:hypothetical protein